jgi:hypothetical protein
MMEEWKVYLETLWDRGRRSFEDLTIPERHQIAGHLLSYETFSEAWDTVYVPDMPFQMANYMMTDNKDILTKLVNEIAETVVHNLRENISVLFENLRKSKHE